MFGPLLSLFLMGMVPVWGLSPDTSVISKEVSVAPPALAMRDELPDFARRLSASGIIITDLQSGQTVFQKNASAIMPMASLTKLMTALLIVENHALDERVRVPDDIDHVEGNSVHLPSGDTFTVGDLLSALLIVSSNDAAVTLARYHSGSEQAFVQAMNARAQVLGLTDTHYDNASGLDSRLQVSTPRDIALLATFVMRIPEIASRMSTADTSITSESGRTMTLSHTHTLLHGNHSSVIAGKTGTTDGAGQCLLSIVEEKNRKYVVVLLHCEAVPSPSLAVPAHSFALRLRLRHRRIPATVHSQRRPRASLRRRHP